jgi:hypothetical protein
VQGDRAYNSEPHGSGLATTRWVFERSLSCLHQFGTLGMREETSDTTHEAVMLLACAIVAQRYLKS